MAMSNFDSEVYVLNTFIQVRLWPFSKWIGGWKAPVNAQQLLRAWGLWH